MTNTALLIIDMQAAYFNTDELAAQKHELVAACNRLIDWAKQSSIETYNIVTEHQRDRSTWTLNMHDDDEGYLFVDSKDVESVEGLNVDGLPRVVKIRDSAFFGTGLAEKLQEKGTQRLIIAGVSTHSCVMMTAADAYANNFRVILAEDAIATHDGRFHEMTFALLQQEYRQSVETVETIISKENN